MSHSTFTFKDHIGLNITNYKWVPEKKIPVKGLLCIIHGVGEHSLRYDFLGKAINKEGYACYAQDLRGHGKSVIDGKLGWFGSDGWNGVNLDIKQLLDIMKKEYPNVPLFLFGHSNGSFVVQDFIQQYGKLLDGVIMSATNGKEALLKLSLFIGKFYKKKLEKTAGFFYNQSIGLYDKPFKNEKMKNSWLSTIKDVVVKYNNDPLCGFRPPNQYFIEISQAMKRIWDPKNEAKIPRNLPIFIFRGEFDSLSRFGKTLNPLLKRYEKIGLKMQYKIYKNARHEAFNDVTREEVVSDIISFLNKNIKSK